MTARDYPWGTMYFHAGTSSECPASVSLATMKVRPGGVSERHFHPNCQEVVLVQKGELVLSLDGEERRYGPGETIVIEKGSPHRVMNQGSEELHLVIAYGSGSRQYEAC